MVWTKNSALAQNKRDEEESLSRSLGLGKREDMQVFTVPGSSNKLELLHKATDEDIGEGQFELDELRQHFNELHTECISDTERRNECLEVAKEYAGMTDFKQARRYLELNYLGPNPRTTIEDKKLLSDIRLRREEFLNAKCQADEDEHQKATENKIKPARSLGPNTCQPSSSNARNLHFHQSFTDGPLVVEPRNSSGSSAMHSISSSTEIESKTDPCTKSNANDYKSRCYCCICCCKIFNFCCS